MDRGRSVCKPSAGRRVRSALLALGVIAASVSGAAAQTDGPMTDGPLTDAAARIDAMLAEGRAQDAVAAARALVREVSRRAGFGVTNARLTMSPATGFGVFVPRPTHVYAVDEPVYAYVELYGFSLSATGTGTNQMLFDVSFTLDDADGRQLTEAMVTMGDVRLETHSQPLDGYFYLTYRITGAVGAFQLRTRVVDRESGAVAEFTLPVEFVQPTPAPRDNSSK